MTVFHPFQTLDSGMRAFIVLETMESSAPYRWGIVIVLAVFAAAAWAGPNFLDFLYTLTLILLVGFLLRRHETAKRKIRGEKRRDND
jgi:hypothetical protein